MTLLELTNSSSLLDDIILLNNTMTSTNCNGNFWYVSINNTVFVGNTNNLNAGVGGLVSTVINIFSCLFGNCPTTTTTAATPVINAITVCTRLIQNNIRLKCSIETQPPIRSDIRTFSYVINNIYAGILYTITAQSQLACYGICSSNDMCVGAIFDNRICTFYL